MNTINAQELSAMRVADIAIKFPQTIEIFNRYNLDYCCGGKRPLSDACKKAGVDVKSISQEILDSAQQVRPVNGFRFESFEPALLIDFILEHHHRYVRETIPQLNALLDKVVNAHGADTPELLAVRENFTVLAEELLEHMPKEEQVLFPLIKKLSEQNNSPASTYVQMPIQVMEHEHESAGNIVKKIRALTNSYQIPAHACPTFRITYTMLEEFDKDLMQHIHLENNILFPKVKSQQPYGTEPANSQRPDHLHEVCSLPPRA